MSENLSFVITGANSHLGRALSECLLEEPHNSLLLTTRGGGSLGGVESGGRVAHCRGLDLTREEDLSELSWRADNFFEGPFHVVNCVGYFPGYKPLEALDLSEARRVYESNVLAVYGAAKALLPLMCRRGGGHFIAFGSHTDYQCYPLMSAFTSAKLAVESLVRSIANEHSKSGIVANTLALATLMTDEEKRLKPHGDHENWLQLNQVCGVIRQLVAEPFKVMNGNTLHLYNHSDSYFHQSYYERIGTKEP